MRACWQPTRPRPADRARPPGVVARAWASSALPPRLGVRRRWRQWSRQSTTGAGATPARRDAHGSPAVRVARALGDPRRIPVQPRHRCGRLGPCSTTDHHRLARRVPPAAPTSRPDGRFFVARPPITAIIRRPALDARRVPRLRHDAARRRAAGGAQPLRRRQAHHRAAHRRPRRRLHRGRLAGREPQGHRVLPPGPRGAAPAARRSSRRSAPPAGPAWRRPTTRWSRRCATAAPAVVTLVAKSHDRHVELALRTTLEENLAMVRDTVAHLRAEGQRVFLDAEHFFDGYRDNRDYALEVLRDGRRGRRRGGRAVRHQRRDAARLGGRRGRRRRRHDRRAQGRHPLPQRHRLRGGQHARRRRRRRDRTCRARSTATASAPATPTWSRVVANLELKLGRAGAARGPAARRHPDRPRRRRGDQRPAGVAPAVRRRQRVRAQGRPARERDQGRPEPLPAHRPGAASATTCGCWSPTWPAARRSSSRAASSASTSPATTTWSPGSPTGSRSWSRGGYTFEAADASFELLLVEEVEGARPSYFDGRVVAGHHRARRARRGGGLRGDGEAARRRASGSS